MAGWAQGAAVVVVDCELHATCHKGLSCLRSPKSVGRGGSAFL